MPNRRHGPHAALPRRRSTLQRSIRLRALRFWWPRIRRRALHLVGGLMVGGMDVARALLADRAHPLFAALCGLGVALCLGRAIGRTRPLDHRDGT